MITRKFLLLILIISLPPLFSCSGSSGVKGEFSKPTAGKALSVTVRRVSIGSPLNLGVQLEMINPSGAKILVTPIKLKVFHENGTETERVYELKRKSLREIEIKGGDIISGTLGVGNPNQNEQAQPGAPAALSPGEKISFTATDFKSAPDRVQFFIGQEASGEQEIFLIAE